MKLSNIEEMKRETVLITGGTKGIGLELANQFARNRYDLVLVARNQTDLQAIAQSLTRDYGCSVVSFALDLTGRDAALDLAGQIEEKGLSIDVLVNNAGIGDYGPFGEAKLERQLDMLQLNIMQLTALTRLFLPGMIERGRGRILNVASVVAFFSAGPSWISYVASKHYVLAFTRGFASELSGSGVTATALCPGPTETNFVAQSGVSGVRVYRWIPKVSAAAVARIGYSAMMKGRTVVVPGLINKVFAFLGELQPRIIAQTVFSFLSRDPNKSIRWVRRTP